METKLLFHFRGCLANLISDMHIIQNLDIVFERAKNRTRSLFRVLALSPTVFGSQFDFFYFVGHLIVFPWTRKDFT